MKSEIIAVIIVIALGIWIVFIFNTLVTLRNRVKNSWAQIDVQLKVRFDLLSNLIETVKGYAVHERVVFENVANARNNVQKAQGFEDRSKAENELEGNLKSLLALVEAYPDLKANQNFLQLQEKLTEVEQKIAFARQFYNDTVMKYNTQIEILPNSIFASVLGFKPRDLFELTSDEERKNLTFKF
jgi:Uncharacterized conserved protein